MIKKIQHLHTRSWFIWFLLLFLYSTGLYASYDSKSSPQETDYNTALSIEGNPRPGGVLFLTLSGLQEQENTEVKGSFAKTSFYLFKSGTLWKTLIPVSRHTKEGTYTIKVQISNSNGTKTFNQTVQIQSQWFGKQYLSLPKSQSDKYEDPELDKEYTLLDNALSTVSLDLYPTVPFQWPVKAPITTNYGISRFVNNEEAGWHKGIDLGADMYAPVAATMQGRVILAKNGFKIHGNTVILDHGHGLISLYIHLNKISVKKGAAVKKGTIIGTVGTTGIATGPHLHWGTYIYGVPVNPQALMVLPKGWLQTVSQK